MRQALDLEHWAAFQSSFHRLLALTREVGAGRRGPPPASIVFLGGDVHQGYLHEAAFRPQAGVRSVVYQAVCSPFRNPLARRDRTVLRAVRRVPVSGARCAVSRTPSGSAIPKPADPLRPPTFDNQLATLNLDGRHAWLRIERTIPGDGTDPALQITLKRRLC